MLNELLNEELLNGRTALEAFLLGVVGCWYFLRVRLPKMKREKDYKENGSDRRNNGDDRPEISITIDSKLNSMRDVIVNKMDEMDNKRSQQITDVHVRIDNLDDKYADKTTVEVITASVRNIESILMGGINLPRRGS